MSTADLERYLDGAVRMTLDSVSYSNPLPPWEDASIINYRSRIELIRRRIADYLSGAATPRPAARVLVPRRSGPPKSWSIPSVNDQIILQLCAFSLFGAVERVIDRMRVYSYRPNTSVALVALTAPQVDSWELFKAATLREVGGRSVLQLDLEQSFASIDRAAFLAFLRDLSDDATVPALIERVLQAISPASEGLPLVNDSVFYLGNAFLTVVDREIATVTHDFIRFVDDYRVFAASSDELDRLLGRISQRLEHTSFRLNPRKTKVGDEKQYMTAINELREAKTGDAGGYVSAVELSGVLDPGELAGQISRALLQPEDLTEGMGRFLLQAVRRMRLNDHWVKARNQPDSPLTAYGEALRKELSDDAVIGALTKFATGAADEWRFIWTLYVAEDLDSKAVKTAADWLNTSKLTPLARVWLARARNTRSYKLTIDEQHDMAYIDAGRALYGAA